jgi:hypothetical protein
MVGVEDIKWGTYQEYEGPVYYGTQKYVMPSEPDEASELLLVLTTTEGGTYDAYNGYDSCICTSGLVQWCDRAPYFLVCKMLGHVAEKNRGLLAPVSSLAQELGYRFARNDKGSWRFFNGTSEVASKEQQRSLYFGGATGLKGSFSPVQKELAKRWAVAFAELWEQPEAQALQREYTLPRLLGFATSSARKILEASRADDGPYCKTLRNAYVSFAANNPRRASDALEAYVATHGVRFTSDWVIGALRSLTYHSGVAIYPHRYDKIRPVLERLYGVNLPDLSSELESWSTVNGFEPDVHTPRGIQKALVALSYDVGPAGADGLWGKHSRAALRQFEKDQDLPAEYQDGVPDTYTVPRLREALEEKGTSFDFTS